MATRFARVPGALLASAADLRAELFAEGDPRQSATASRIFVDSALDVRYVMNE